jgi:ABC-type glycerol-3-phosphate transport system substrate-binding protein
MSLYNGQIFGQPFAGDALVMAYRPVVVGDPPTTWDEVLQSGRVFAFPAAEERALYTLALYESRGGELYDEDGRLQLSQTFLESVFNFYQKAEEANVMPYLLTQYTTDELSWQAFMENRTQMNITWATRYFSRAPEGISAAAIPTYDGVPFTLATGWVWTLTGADPNRRQQAVDLLEFLTEEEFLGLWTSAAGFLPPRPSSLAFWPQGSDQALASQILPSASLIPDESLLDFLGNLLTQATIDILKQAATAEEATDTVIASLVE